MRITTFQIPLRPEDLRAQMFANSEASLLAEPLQALVAAVTRRAADAPVSVYLCADDDSTRARDDFALALARALVAHVASTLLVDCDFLHPGLSDHVPQKDALGFLDYLLYGSSIGVITQDHEGVHVVGAGSFPVTKRMPFAESAFADASRRLVTHARCVLFVGPAFDGDGGRHPLSGVVDVVAVVRTGGRNARLDGLEEQVSSHGPEVWSIRFDTPAPAEPSFPAVPAASPPPAAPPPRPAARPAPVPASAGKPDEERTPSSLVPRVVVIVLALLVIAFVVWWFMQNRGSFKLAGDHEETPPSTIALTADTTRVRPDSLTASRDTAASREPPAPARRDSVAAVKPRPATAASGAANPAASPASQRRTGGTMLVNSGDIQVMDDLNRRFKGWYMVHISSFQTSVRARDEIAFLESREFPAFIVFLDLGPKGKWYRVYVGPFETRDEATVVKKNLDAIPQVRFTRIATIPD